MVSLSEMTEDRFPAYRDQLVRDYAQDKVEAGVWSREEAVGRAAADIDALLPRGPRTENHLLYTVREDPSGDEVGMLWLALPPGDTGGAVWIYDIEILARFRRRGYARETLEAVESESKKRGAVAVEQHVFGHNAAARALYEGAGYVTTSLNMKKSLA